MRKIEMQMVEAIRNGKNWSKDNTCVTFDTGANENRKNYLVVLHGNPIARGCVGKTPEAISFCGWVTKTTCSRLRALGVDVKVVNRIPVVEGVSKENSTLCWINLNSTCNI